MERIHYLHGRRSSNIKEPAHGIVSLLFTMKNIIGLTCLFLLLESALCTSVLLGRKPHVFNQRSERQVFNKPGINKYTNYSLLISINRFYHLLEWRASHIRHLLCPSNSRNSSSNFQSPGIAFDFHPYNWLMIIQIDTGSSNLVIPALGCTTCSNVTQFEPSESSTYSSVGCSSRTCRICNTDGRINAK